MKTKGILVSAVLLLVFLVIAILFARPSSPDFTIRHFKRNVSQAYGISETFAVTNNRASQCNFCATEVQVLEGKYWKTCSRIVWKAYQVSSLDPHKGTFYTLENTALPVGRRLRLKADVSWELRGLNGLPMRLELNRLGRTTGMTISLNPFDKKSHVFGSRTEAVSEEWVEPGK